MAVHAKTLNLESLAHEIEHLYELRFTGGWVRLTGGEESEVWSVDADRSFIVRIGPTWRTSDELQWVHDLTAHCAASIPEAVAPIRARDGSSVFRFHDHPVSLYPYVEGEPLDTENQELCLSAARLLARIHRTASTWQGGQRPPSRSTAPQPIPVERWPEVFIDPELDRWHDSISHLTTGPIHGDYYCTNLLCIGEEIRGVIDWDEARIAPLMAEIGWCTWEFAQTPSGDELDDDRARAFLNAYFEAGSPCPRAEADHTIPFIRWRLRSESLLALAAVERGEDLDMEYTQQQMRAFERLTGREL